MQFGLESQGTHAVYRVYQLNDVYLIVPEILSGLDLPAIITLLSPNKNYDCYERRRNDLNDQSNSQQLEGAGVKQFTLIVDYRFVTERV